ncbi:MAG: hypothetical protein KIT57_08870 [Blastocatellales bacterium]|nr:hypothetical protein [Blastocatellales bacterium]
MHNRIFALSAVWLCLLFAVTTATAGVHTVIARTVIYDGVATEVAPAPTLPPGSGPSDLWVTLADLKRATGFEVKPKGVCRDELCFPLPRTRQKAFISKQGRKTWFNLSEFARLVRQPEAYDADAGVWYFGPRATVQNGFVDSLLAPDFTLPDANGRMRSLHEFRGRKVLLLTWASW